MEAYQYSEFMSRLIARAWADEAFHDLLKTDPVKALAALGWKVPPGLKVTVLQNTEQECFLALPMKPALEELSEEALDGITGSGTYRYNSSACSCH